MHVTILTFGNNSTRAKRGYDVSDIYLESWSEVRLSFT